MYPLVYTPGTRVYIALTFLASLCQWIYPIVTTSRGVVGILTRVWCFSVLPPSKCSKCSKRGGCRLNGANKHSKEGN